MDKSEKTRRFIIETAAPIFNKKGYEGTSLSDILKMTTLTKGAIYGHFKNKDELALSALDHNLRISTSEMTAIFNSTENSYSKIIAFTKGYSSSYEKIMNIGGCPVLNGSVDSDDGNENIRMKILKFIKTWEKTLQTMIISGQQCGELSPDIDPVHFSGLYITIIEGGFMLSKITGDRKHLDNAVNHIISIIEEMRVV